MKYKVKVTQIHPNNWNGPKYKVELESNQGIGSYGHNYMCSRLFTKRCVKKLIKKRNVGEFKPKVVEEFEL